MARLTVVTVRLRRHYTSSLRIKKVIYSKLAKITEMYSKKLQLYRNPSDLLFNIIHKQCIKMLYLQSHLQAGHLIILNWQRKCFRV